MRHGLFVSISLVTALSTVSIAADAPKRGVVTVTPEALAIHREAILVDGHNDLPWEMRERGQVELPDSRHRQAAAAAAHRYPAPEGRRRRRPVLERATSRQARRRTRRPIRKTLEQIDVVHRMVRAYPDVFALALTVDDILRARKDGKIASLIGVEGGHSIDNSLGVLRSMHALGVRYMTLTHSESLDWADSATDKPKANGLSPFGEQVVAEMNRLGMLVDISHVSAETMKHALRVTQGPGHRLALVGLRAGRPPAQRARRRAQAAARRTAAS